MTGGTIADQAFGVSFFICDEFTVVRISVETVLDSTVVRICENMQSC